MTKCIIFIEWMAIKYIIIYVIISIWDNNVFIMTFIKFNFLSSSFGLFKSFNLSLLSVWISFEFKGSSPFSFNNGEYSILSKVFFLLMSIYSSSFSYKEKINKFITK